MIILFLFNYNFFKMSRISQQNKYDGDSSNSQQQKRKSNATQNINTKYSFIPNYKLHANSQNNSQFESQTSKAPQRVDLARKNYQEKLKVLGKVKYINQLAQLDYQEKLTEVYTKHSKVSKASMLKKIKARNQLADFIEQESQHSEDFEQLMDYKYGKNNNFFFERDEQNQYRFCPDCDEITNDHPQAHWHLCKRYSQNQENSEQTLLRILDNLARLTSLQSRQLSQLIKKFLQHKNKTLALNQLSQINKNDKITTAICKKLQDNIFA